MDIKIKSVIILAGFFSIFINSINLCAETDVLVNIRFYKAAKVKAAGSSNRITTFFYDSIPGEKPDSVFSVKEEKEKIMELYGLSGIELKTDTSWKWPKKHSKPSYIKFVLDRNTFGILIIRKEKDFFRVQIFEGENFEARSKNLLDTEIALLEENRVVFGFKDSSEQIYFLSFFRTKDLPVSSMGKRKKGDLDILKLIYIRYPEEALKRGIEGLVVLKGDIEKNGGVKSIQALKGDTLLVDAVKKSFKRWRFTDQTDHGESGKRFMFLVVSFVIAKKTGTNDSDEIIKKRLMDDFNKSELFQKISEDMKKEKDAKAKMKFVVVQMKQPLSQTNK